MAEKRAGSDALDPDAASGRSAGGTPAWFLTGAGQAGTGLPVRPGSRSPSGISGSGRTQVLPRIAPPGPGTPGHGGAHVGGPQGRAGCAVPGRQWSVVLGARRMRPGRLVIVAIAVGVLGGVVMIARSGDAPGAPATGGHTAAVRDPDVILGARCWATHYGSKKAPGSRTASGEVFDPQALTAATSHGRSPQLPFGAMVRVENVANGRSVVVRVNDRGTFAASAREPDCLDLTDTAFARLGPIRPDPGHFVVTETVLSAGCGPWAAATSSARPTPPASTAPTPPPYHADPQPVGARRPTGAPRPVGTPRRGAYPKPVHHPSAPPRPPVPAGDLITGIGGKCVGVRQQPAGPGDVVELQACAGGASQRWTFAADGTVRALGLCLDVTGGSHDDGVPVQLWGCNGTGAQKWSTGQHDSFVNVGSGLCLDATDKQSADGTVLQVWSCWGGGNQAWRWR